MTVFPTPSYSLNLMTARMQVQHKKNEHASNVIIYTESIIPHGEKKIGLPLIISGTDGAF